MEITPAELDLMDFLKPKHGATVGSCFDPDTKKGPDFSDPKRHILFCLVAEKHVYVLRVVKQIRIFFLIHWLIKEYERQSTDYTTGSVPAPLY